MRRGRNCGVDDVALVKQRGFSMLDVKHYVESLDTRGRGYRIDEERPRPLLRVPALMPMDMRGFRHFVVLKQVRSDKLAGPMPRNCQMPLAFRIPYMF